MSYLTDHPDLMVEIIAKLVHRLGGYVKVTKSEPPTGGYDLKSRPRTGEIELLLTDGKPPT